MDRDPDALVAAFEASLDAPTRAAGAVYTPRPLADALVARALDGLGPAAGSASTVCDPAVGGGTFLLAAADALVRRGVAPTEVVGTCLWGADVDPAAVEVAAGALEAWLAGQGGDERPGGGADRAGVPGAHDALRSLRGHLVTADSLASSPSEIWPDRPVAGFDVVVGNPPFQDQLTVTTARSAERAAALRRRLGSVVTPYADTAALFLVVAVELVRPSGRVVLIVPQSVLAAHDAAPARAAVLARARLDGLWSSSGPVFASAAVEVCAPLLTAADGDVAPGLAPSVARWRGIGVDPAPPLATAGRQGHRGSWSFLVGDLLGVPASGLPPVASPESSSPAPSSRRARADGVGPAAATLGSLVRATAGFRDQYYGVAPFVREAGPAEDPDRPLASRTASAAAGRATDPRADDPADDPVDDPAPTARLVTSGLVEPGRCDWGRRPCRFAGRAWDRPIVDLDPLRRVDPGLGRWVDLTVTPKVVLATQTPVLEAAVDRLGRWWPSVPVVAVVPEDVALLDRVAAVLLAPPVSAWAFERAAGTALSRAAVKLAARDVVDVPLPVDEGAWAAAAAHVPELDADDPEQVGRVLDDVGRLMTRAYRGDDTVLAWWRARVARRRPADRRARRRPRAG